MNTLRRAELEVPLQVLLEALGDGGRSAGPSLHGGVVDTVTPPATSNPAPIQGPASERIRRVGVTDATGLLIGSAFADAWS